MKDYFKISSRDNALIKLIAALQTSAKMRQENRLFVLEGLRICMDAYDNGIKFEKLVISDSALEKHSDIINSFSFSAAQTVLVPDSLFKKIADTNEPQGILAVVKMPEITAIAQENGRYIGLENLQDPSNLGAIARTAEALGVSGIIMTDNSCDPFSPKVLRASMGTILRLPLFITDDICGYAKTAKLRTIACVIDKEAASISDIGFKNGDILLIGNEANGLTENTKLNADIKTTIRMQGSAESLNAAAAAAIAMWEMVKL